MQACTCQTLLLVAKNTRYGGLHRGDCAGNLQMRAGTYFRYMRLQQDDAPLYLFDKHFATTSPQLASEYSVPEAFSEDLFAILGDARPDYRCCALMAAYCASPCNREPGACHSMVTVNHVPGHDAVRTMASAGC